jgi:hypothetical protein
MLTRYDESLGAAPSLSTMGASFVDAFAKQYGASGSIITALSDPNKQAGLIPYIQISSNLSPTVRVDQPLAATPTKATGIAGAIMKLVRPSVEIQIQGMQPLIIQPYGAPNPTTRAIFLGGSVLALAALIYLAIQGIRK